MARRPSERVLPSASPHAQGVHHAAGVRSVSVTLPHRPTLSSEGYREADSLCKIHLFFW